MKRIFLIICPLLFLASCHSSEGEFCINGSVEGATDSMLYLEALTVDKGLQVVDSAKLSGDCTFEFTASDTASCPEFYRLRIADQVINLSIDSTETVTVKAKWPNMAFNYEVEGSGNCDTIRIMSYKLAALENTLHQVEEDNTLTLDERQAKGDELIKDYKDSLKIDFIQNRYEKASSYYAIFQMLGGYMLFDLQSDPSDIRWATAIANAWLTYYPGSIRTKNLESIVRQGIKTTRKARPVTIDPSSSKVKETGIIDMTYPDIHGRERSLSDLKGKVVLLEFTAYAANGAMEDNIKLHELYDKYHDQGLEIYQVSLDEDLHRWKLVSGNLPWITVHDEDGVQSDMVKIYQVSALPCCFLIDRNNDLFARQENISDIEEAIKGLL